MMEHLKKMSEREIKDFIRERLKFDGDISDQLRHVDCDLFEKKEHKRFEMSGYDGMTGDCTLKNLSILNLFADLRIYDYTRYLFLDFYQGKPTVYLKFEFDGYGTIDIIYEIFKLTIFSDKKTRRRW